MLLKTHVNGIGVSVFLFCVHPPSYRKTIGFHCVVLLEPTTSYRKSSGVHSVVDGAHPLTLKNHWCSFDFVAGTCPLILTELWSSLCFSGDTPTLIQKNNGVPCAFAGDPPSHTQTQLVFSVFSVLRGHTLSHRKPKGCPCVSQGSTQQYCKTHWLHCVLKGMPPKNYNDLRCCWNIENMWFSVCCVLNASGNINKPFVAFKLKPLPVATVWGNINMNVNISITWSNRIYI